MLVVQIEIAELEGRLRNDFPIKVAQAPADNPHHGESQKSWH